MKKLNEPKVKNSTSLQITFTEYMKLKKELNELWERTPAEIRDLIYGDDAVFINRDDALGWLVTPHPDLDNKSPVEAVTNGESEKVKAIINNFHTGLPL